MVSDQDVRVVVRQLLRRAKPGGRVYIGEVSDLAKRDLALALRRKSHKHEAEGAATAPKPVPTGPQADHLYVPRSLFVEVAAELGVPQENVTVVDHDTLGLR